MLVDARTLPNGTRLETDVCIVGGGAAGITLAREFINAPFRVCLLEGGGLEFDEDAQSLFDGANVGLPYYPLWSIRLRYFGGTTNHWTGLCRPLDEFDFENRPWVPWSGWPIQRDEMEPFYRRAHSICELGPYDYAAAGWESSTGGRGLSLDRQRVVTTMSQLSPPTRFGERYRKEIVDAENCSAYLYANVVELQSDAAMPGVTQVRVATLEGKNLSVRARLFILACGAIENARMLLVSDTRHAGGLGNQNDMVGRFFMEHLSVPGAFFLPSRPDMATNLYSGQRRDGTFGIGHLALSPEVLRREQLLNVRAFVLKSSPEELSGKSAQGVLSAGFLWNALKAGKLANNFRQHLAKVIEDIDAVSIQAYERAFRPSSGVFALSNHVEQAPNPESRVRLTRERDRLDMRRVQLDWRIGELERRTLERANEIMGLELGRAGLGRVQLVESEEDTGWPPGLRGAWHQMGMTRMSADPKHGVVDADCRVHGIANLYVAGGSVFPTSGYANPTLTIVALAVRLADHVKQRMTG